MRVLTLTTLYPSNTRPNHGVFVENRLRRTLEYSHNTGTPLEARVIAPVPWFPSDAKLFGSYADYAATAVTENRHNIDIRHPRYFLPPKVGMTYAVDSLARCFETEALKLLDAGWDFDLIDAHYYYPDGVAAAQVARKLGKPIVITARGTDINLIPQYPKQRQMIIEATNIADASITVCQALKDEMVAIGATKDKITVLRNGVDLELFAPKDRESLRAEMGLSGKIAISVGHLTERKGHDLVIKALTDHPDITLLIAGSGEEENNLRALINQHGLEQQVQFLGQIPHSDLPNLYSIADVLVLASSREGWPNVLLEAMACGTPCIATPVWGSGEVITKPEAGLLSRDRTPRALSEAIGKIFADNINREKTRLYAEGFSWDETAAGVLKIFKDISQTSNSASSTTSVQHPIWKTHDIGPPQNDQPKLIVTVDTEEIFDWSSSKFDDYHMADPADIHQFQLICEAHGIKPLYFVTYSILKNPANAQYFKQLADRHAADFGLHLHQWVTPPFKGDLTFYTSYQCNLPPDLHTEKLENLAALFKDTFGYKPTSHRAGRYGVSPEILDALSAQGITHDFSPSAGFDLTSDGGPDFSLFTSHPFQRTSEAGDTLICYPASGARAYAKTRLFMPQPRTHAGLYMKQTLLGRTQSAAMRLSPEGFSLKDMKSLTNHLIKQKATPLSLSMHSTSTTIGATSYSGSQNDIDVQLARVSDYFTWFKEERQGAFIGLGDLAKPTQIIPQRKAS